MTKIDLELEGVQELLDDFRELERKFGENTSRIVTSGAEYSAILEFGRGPIEADEGSALKFEDEDGNTIYRTSVTGHPPYPFFGPAVREYQANPEAFILKNTDLDSLDGVSSTEEMVEIVASSIQAQVRKNANANRSGRSPGTHPDHPVVDSGNLVARVQVIDI